MSKWQTFNLYPNKQELPIKSCVYGVYFDDDLVYIGQTKNLRNRFNEHRFRYSYGKTIITPWQEVDSDVEISIKVRFSERYGDWAMWEIRLIRKINPLFNSHYKKGVKKNG